MSVSGLLIKGDPPLGLWGAMDLPVCGIIRQSGLGTDFSEPDRMSHGSLRHHSRTCTFGGFRPLGQVQCVVAFLTLTIFPAWFGWEGKSRVRRRRPVRPKGAGGVFQKVTVYLGDVGMS